MYSTNVQGRRLSVCPSFGRPYHWIGGYPVGFGGVGVDRQVLVMKLSLRAGFGGDVLVVDV